MKVLDLYCGAGGATRGYQDAGAEVWGIDNRPQPHYCGDHFFQYDVAGCKPWIQGEFDLIHASPPCQAYSALRTNHRNRDYPELIDPTRELLEASGVPYVIENVPGAPLRADLMLCGSMFGLGAAGRQLRRHRIFELGGGLEVPQPECRHHGPTIGVYGHGRWDNSTSKHRGGYQGSKTENAEAMGIDWMNRDELAQAIPPDYTYWIATAGSVQD